MRWMRCDPRMPVLRGITTLLMLLAVSSPMHLEAQDLEPLAPPSTNDSAQAFDSQNAAGKAATNAPVDAIALADGDGGNASAEAAQPTVGRNLFGAILGGGPMLMMIVACSVVLFIFVFERLISLRRGRVIPGPFVTRMVQQLQDDELDADSALQLCRDNKSPVSDVFEAGIKKWGRPAVEVEQAVLDAGERVASRLRKYLRIFHGISTISPLLGLLGTVTGMISAFKAIATSDAMGRPELLADGISQALLTTAGGLNVGVPAIVAHLFFVGRAGRMVMEIDAYSQDVVNAIAAAGWREARPSKKAGKGQKQKAA